MRPLRNKIDLAVHSMKDVPTQLPAGIAQAAVLKRASWKDLLIYKGAHFIFDEKLAASDCIIATSSIRRKAQWLNRYPHHSIENLRGNVNTRLRKLEESNWNGAIFAAAGLERIALRPSNATELDWMLPAPAQGAITVACRSNDEQLLQTCSQFNDTDTALCTKIERDFLRALLGGCSTPISALAIVHEDQVQFRGNILSVDGKHKVEIDKTIRRSEAADAGKAFATELLANGGQEIADGIQKK